ncbi:unnamed protein product, partial [Iphiclides podalirius]
MEATKNELIVFAPTRVPNSNRTGQAEGRQTAWSAERERRAAARNIQRPPDPPARITIQRAVRPIRHPLCRPSGDVFRNADGHAKFFRAANQPFRIHEAVPNFKAGSAFVAALAAVI